MSQQSARTIEFPTSSAATDARVTPARGGDLLVRALEAAGVRVVFAYPGGASLEIHQALARSRQIRTILPRHEQGGAFAACGFARATGRAGVCIATSGPGATNLVTGIADAFMDSTPLVAITGQVPRALIGKGAFQEIDVLGLTRPITKRQFQPQRAAEIPQVVRAAFAAAEGGRPGPVLIDVPKDVQLELGIPEAAPEDPPAPPAPAPIPRATLDAILDRIAAAERPVLYVGGGLVSAGPAACAALRELAERTGLPVTTTLMGIGVFPETHPQSLRWLGMHGAAYANWAVDAADLLIAIGARFDDRVTGRVDRFAPGAYVIHADVDPRELGKNKPADLAIACDAGALLEALVGRLRARPARPDLGAWWAQIEAWKARAPFGFRADPAAAAAHLPGVEASEWLDPQLVVERLAALTGGEAILTTGVGQHQMWAAQFYRFNAPRRFLTSGGLGAMGFGYPAALGAKLAFPDREVVDVDGDGSFLMNLQELATAKVEGIAAKAIVLNNQHLGMVVQLEDYACGGVHAHTYLGDPAARAGLYPDFVGLVRGFGVACERIVHRRELEPALRRLLAAREPYVLEVVIPHAPHVLPYIKSGGTVADMIL